MEVERFNQFTNLSSEERFSFELLRKQYEEAFPLLAGEKNKEKVYNIMIVFLRCRKWNVESAFQKLSGFHMCKLKYPDVFSNMNITHAAKLLKHWKITVLKAPDRKGGAVVVCRVGTIILDHGTYEDFLSVVGCILIHLNWSQKVQEYGMTGILDYTGTTWRLAKNVGPTKIYKSLDIYLTATPWRVNGLHAINGSALANRVFNAGKFVCPKKLGDKFHVHRSLESLHEEFSPDILPDYLGGTLTDEEAGQEEYQGLDLLPSDVHTYYEDLSELFLF